MHIEIEGSFAIDFTEKDYSFSLAIYINFLLKISGLDHFIVVATRFLPFIWHKTIPYLNIMPNVYSLLGACVYICCFAKSSFHTAGMSHAFLMFSLNPLMHRHAISFETVQGRPVTMVESFHPCVGFSFSDGPWT